MKFHKSIAVILFLGCAHPVPSYAVFGNFPEPFQTLFFLFANTVRKMESLKESIDEKFEKLYSSKHKDEEENIYDHQEKQPLKKIYTAMDEELNSFESFDERRNPLMLMGPLIVTSCNHGSKIPQS